MAGRTAKLTIQPAGEPWKCLLETNQGDVLEYKPNYGKIREDIECIDYGRRDKTCSIGIEKVNSTHAGVWKLMAHTTQNNTQTVFRGDNAKKVETFTFLLYIQVNLASYRASSDVCVCVFEFASRSAATNERGNISREAYTRFAPMSFQKRRYT